MLRIIGLLALGIAIASGGVSSAAGRDAAATCGPGMRPVVSEGLPQRPCAGAETGVIVHRGPAVAPEPSARAPEAPPRRIYRVKTPQWRSPGRARPIHALPILAVPWDGRLAPYFRLVIGGGDFRLVIGRGLPPPRWPVHPRPRHPRAYPPHPHRTPVPGATPPPVW